MIQGFGDLQGALDGLFQRERPVVLHQVPHIDPFNVLEDDVVPPLVFANIVDTRNVGMVEPGRTLRFVAEPPQRILIRLVAGDHLHGHRAPEHRVGRPKHGTHPAATDKLLQLEMSQHFAGQRRAHLVGIGGPHKRRCRGRRPLGNDRLLTVHRIGPSARTYRRRPSRLHRRRPRRRHRRRLPRGAAGRTVSSFGIVRVLIGHRYAKCNGAGPTGRRRTAKALRRPKAIRPHTRPRVPQLNCRA